jgi:hypothetical protein
MGALAAAAVVLMSGKEGMGALEEEEEVLSSRLGRLLALVGSEAVMVELPPLPSALLIAAAEQVLVAPFL